MNDEYKQIEKTLRDVYESKTHEENLKFEVLRLKRIPFKGNVILPNASHPSLSHFQKILGDLATIYTQGCGELTLLCARSILEAVIRAKIEKDFDQEIGLYRLIELTDLPISFKEKAHIIRKLGNLVAHWTSQVNMNKVENLLKVKVTDKYGPTSFDLLIPEEWINANHLPTLLTELGSTKVYNDLIDIMKQL